MFLLKRKKNDEQRAVYESIITNARNPILYTEYTVPDNPAGRFQMIVLHAMPVMLGYMKTNNSTAVQNLFDMIFADIELSFREIGVGDLSVPKKMKAYMKDFNGVLHAHAAAGADHVAITQKNVFGDDAQMNEQFADYIRLLFQGV